MSVAQGERNHSTEPENNPRTWGALFDQNMGIFNNFRPRPASAPVRAEEDMQRIRLGLMEAYLKFVIQAFCYLLATYVAWRALSMIFCIPLVILIPSVVFISLQAAANSMRVNQEGHFDTMADDHLQASLTTNVNWALNKGFKLIDGVADFAARRFFTESLKESLKDAKFLDNQIAFIPNAAP